MVTDEQEFAGFLKEFFGSNNPAFIWSYLSVEKKLYKSVQLITNILLCVYCHALFLV